MKCFMLFMKEHLLLEAIDFQTYIHRHNKEIGQGLWAHKKGQRLVLGSKMHHPFDNFMNLFDICVEPTTQLISVWPL